MAAFIIYIIRWAVVLTMLYSLYGLFMKRDTLHSVNRIVLLLVLTASMVLPFVQIHTKEANMLTQGREIIEYQIQHTQNPLADDVNEVSITNQDQGIRNTRMPIREYLNAFILIAIAVYLVGLIICWLRYFWQMAALVLMIHRSSRIKTEGVPSHVHVVTNPDVKAPCSWMQWVILNPVDVNTRAIMNHELAHIHYGHSLDMLLCELTCRMLWFVPFAWMLRQDLRDVHEYQADRRVLQSGINENEYQLLLIRKATSAGLQPVVNAFNQSPIKRRFKMMYKKPSRRWVALKAAYLLPLGTMALMAFARPQAITEIEEKVEEGTGSAASLVEEVIKAVTPPSSPEGATTAPAENTIAAPSGAEWGTDTVPVLPDANLVNADLTESGTAALVSSPAKSPVQLLDSTMQAVGAQKIAEGTYLGHFQPNLNNDTVRIATLTIRNRESQTTAEHRFAHASHPYAYDITLNAETRKGRTGYYIRYLKPVSSTVRNYDRKIIDPKMLSTDSVLTKRSSKEFFYYKPAAIERNKKETRIYMYTAYKGKPQVDIWRTRKENHYSNMAIVDELTGDKYVCRATDYDYFKYVREEYIPYMKDGRNGKDTVEVYQVCLVFPPLDKKVQKAHFGDVDHDDAYSNTFDLNKIPRKGRVITN